MALPLSTFRRDAPFLTADGAVTVPIGTYEPLPARLHRLAARYQTVDVQVQLLKQTPPAISLGHRRGQRQSTDTGAEEGQSYQVSIIITHIMGRSGPLGRRGTQRDVRRNVNVQGASAATTSGGPLRPAEDHVPADERRR